MARRLQNAQTNFNAGEIDPLLAERDDVKYYYSGAERLRNAISIPQGGARRRPGLRYLDVVRPTVSRITSGVTPTAPNGGTAANANDGSNSTEVTTTNNISTTNPYIVVHYDLGSAKTVLFADVRGFRLSAGSGGDGEWRVQYSTDNVTFSNFGKSGQYIPATTADRHRRFSSNNPRSVTARYWRFVRIGSTDFGTAKATIDEFSLWEAASPAALSAVKMPSFAFSTEQEYQLLVTDQNVAVYKDDVWQCDVALPNITSSKISRLNWTQSLDTMLLFHYQVATQKLQRQGGHDQWQVDDVTWSRQPTYQWDNPDTTVTGTPAATSGTGINFTAGGAFFTAGMVGKYIRGGGGFALIAGYTSSTVVTINVIEPYRFTNTNPIGAGDWTIEEDVWSSAHGYPGCGTFHQGRLWLAGSYGRPQTLWGSKSGLFFDYGSGSGLDDEAIDVTLDSDGVSAIYNIYSGRELSIFTQDSEWYLKESVTEPITPKNVRAKRATSRGTKPGLRVIEITGSIMFLQRFGKSLHEFMWNDAEQGYTSGNLSLLSSHLISDPSCLVARKSSSTDEADLVLIVNSDGTLAILTTLREQNITAFSLQKTQGNFIEAGVTDRDMYFTIDRTVGGSTVRYFEKFDSSLLLDCALTATRPTKDTYTATAGQTTFAFTHSVTSDTELRVRRYNAASADWEEFYPTSGFTTTGIPGTGNVILVDPCAAGDTVVISYPTTTFSGMTHLIGNQVRIVADDLVKSVATVDGSGNATVTDEAWVTDAECGLEFPDVTGRGQNEGVQIKNMPPAPQLQDGSHKGLLRRVVNAVVHVYQTRHFNVVRKGHIYTLDFDFLDTTPSLLDNAAQDFSGIKEVRGLLGWDKFGQVEITQSVPAPLTVLSLTTRIFI